MDATEQLDDTGTQTPPPALPQAPAAPHPLADLGFKPISAAPAAAAHPLSDLGFKPSKTIVPTGPVAGTGGLIPNPIPAAPVPAGLQTPNVVPPPTAPAPPAGPTVAGTGPLVPHNLPAHPAANLQPSLAGELYGATREAATHPVETLVGADLPSQTEEKQASLEKAAAGGDKQAQSALDVIKTEQSPTIHPSDTEGFQKVLDPKSKNVFSRVMTGGTKALEALSSPDNIGLMATLPFAPEQATKLLSGIFSTQMVAGAGSEGLETIRAAHRGDYGEAAEKGAGTLITALMAAAAAKHATEATAKPSSGGSEVPRGTLPAEGEEKPVLHASDDVEELRKSAERQAPAIGDAAKAATEGVPGAKLEAVRDSKDSDRIADKADRQEVKPSQITDIAAAKIVVPDQEAADKVLGNLHKTMPVESVNGAVDGAAGKNGVRQVQAVVDIGAGEGEPVKKAEILIQTPEMAAATESTHDDYRRAQELRAEGKDDEADAIEKRITAIHEKAANGAEGQYKFGSTQTDIPADSEAHTALESARTKIDDKDLAGQGKDVGGNHVTVRYGIQGDDTAAIEKYLRSQAPFEAKLGEVSSFPPSKNSDGAAVLKADIDAPELHRLNAEIDQHGDFKKSDFPDYKPHATLAYVKPEAVDKYVGKAGTEGKTFQVREIAITDRNGDAKVIPLEGKRAIEPDHVERWEDTQQAKDHQDAAFVDPGPPEGMDEGDFDDDEPNPRGGPVEVITPQGKRIPLEGGKSGTVEGDRGKSPEPAAGRDRGVAPAAELPERPDVAGHDGRATDVLTPARKMPSTYRLVEADSLIPSHNAQSFDENPDYPKGVQERDYKGSKEAQNRVIQQAQNYDPAYTVNTNPDAVNGPPVVTPDGTVLGGNSRAMSTQRLYADGKGDVYKDVLKRDAATFGVTPEQVEGMKQPVLVRQIERPASVEDARRIGSELNKSMTGALGTSEKAVSAGKNLKPETLRTVADMMQHDDSSLRELLSKRGPELLKMMTADGAITERERPQFMDAGTGGLSEEGKTFFERALMGSVIDDPRLMDAAPKAVLGKLERSLGSIASFGSRPDEWNLLPALRQAVQEHTQIAKNGSTVDLHLGQRDMFAGPRNPIVDALVRTLDAKPNTVRAKFEQFANDADENPHGQARMFGGGEAFEAFNEAFGSKLTDEGFHNAAADILRTDPARAAEPKQEAAAKRDAGVPERADRQPARGGSEGDGQPRAPKPPGQPERQVQGAGAAGEAKPSETKVLAPADGELKAPKPPQPKETFKSGSQDTPIEVRVDGKWKMATLDYYPADAPEATRRARVTLANGEKIRSVKEVDMRPDTYRPPEGEKAEMKPATKLPEEKAIIDRTRERLPEMTHEYRRVNQRDGVVNIATDAAKEMFPEFKANPTTNERLVHVAASAIADAAMNTELAKPVVDGRDRVNITTASPGSGKTFTLSADDEAKVGLRHETIMTNVGDATTEVQKILDSGRKPVLNWIYVDDPAKTVSRMAYRAAGHDGKPGIGRTVPIEYMARAYTQVPKSLLTLMNKFGDRIEVRAVDNSGGVGEMKLVENPRQLLEESAQWNQQKVYGEMKAQLEALKEKGVFEGEKGKAIYEIANSADGDQPSTKAPAEEAGTDGRAGSDSDRAGDGGQREQAGEDGSKLSGAVLDREEQGAKGSAATKNSAAEPSAQPSIQRDSAVDAGVVSGQSPDGVDAFGRSELGEGKVSQTSSAGDDGGRVSVRQPDAVERSAGGGDRRSESNEAIRRDSKDNAERAAARKDQLDAAAKRTQRENAAKQKSEVVEAAGRKALVLDPDGEAVWHRLFRKVAADAEGRNPLGAGEKWRGMSLTKTQVNTALAYLHGATGDLDASLMPDGGAKEGYQRMIQTLKDARNEQGGATILRSDYRADTAREEATHAWQMEHGLDKSDAIKSVAEMPEFEEAADKLRDMGYEDATPRTLAIEGMAKAMAGDPDFELTDAQRESLVRSFLTEAVEDKGPGILKNLPETDPRLKALIDEVSRGYDNDDEHNQRNEGSGGSSARSGDGQAGDETGKEDGTGKGAGGDRTDEGPERSVQKERPQKDQLTGSDDEPVFQRAKAPKPPPSMALPGMEDADAERERAASEEEGRRLTEALREPGKNISSAAGEMERDSPLFRGTGENPLLFQKAKEGENPVARSVSDLVEDLKALPKAEKGTMLDRVSSWTKDAITDSITRSGKALGGIPGKFEKAFAWAKATSAALIHDYQNPLEQTDWKTQAGQMQLAQAETALHLDELAKTLKDAAPKTVDRIAMTHYMEAGGDEAKLKKWQAGNKARAMAEIGTERGRYLREAQQHYDKALDLSPEQKTLAKRLRQHFDDMLELAKQNGLLEYGYRNYVMHLYEKAEAANILHLIDTSELNPDPSFLKRRFHDTFYSAEGDGLTPKTKDIGYLLTAYDKSMNEAISSRAFMKSLLDAKAPDGRPIAAIKTRGGWVIAKGDQQPLVLAQRARPKTLEGYRDFDRPQLRNFLFKPTTDDLAGFDPKLFDEDPEKLAFKGDLIIHPKYASRVEDMLTPSWFERGEGGAQKLGSAIVKGSALAKEMMTAIAPFHMVQEGVHGMEHKVNPFKLPKLDLTDETQRLLASHGLTLTNYDAEGLFGTKALKGLGEAVPGVNKAMDAMHSFSRWQFQDYIPRLKMRMATEAFERNVERYPKLSKEQVAELTSKQSNAAFGNLNTTFDSIPRTKTFKTLLRLATFAPDFLESRIRFVGQAFTKYGGEQRAALVRGALVMYAAARITNALLNNGDAKWDKEHAFSIVRNGRSYSLRTVQGDILHAVTDPRGFIYNRLNPLTTRPIVEFLSGRDQFGRQKSAISQAKDLGKATLPFGLQKVIQTPDEDWLNSILTSTGLESKNYRTPTEDAVHKLYIAGIPDSNDDEEKQAESRKLRGIEDKVRSGHMAPGEVWKMVEKKEITPREAGRTISRAQKSRLQIEFAGLHLKDAIDVYAHATPLEQAELKPQFAKKQAAIADLPEAQREKTAAKMQELLAMNNH